MPFFWRPSNRRTFLSSLAATPLIAAAGAGAPEAESQLGAPRRGSLEIEREAFAPPAMSDMAGLQSVKELEAAVSGDGRKEALNIFDFENTARAKMKPQRFNGLLTGSFNNETIRANREGFAKYQIRLRRLMGIREVDQSVQIFGAKYDAPIYLCPTGSPLNHHPDGIQALARAAGARNILQVLSTNWPNPCEGCPPVEQLNQGRSKPVWFNIGAAPDRELIGRLEQAGCQTIVWTVDRRAEGSPLDPMNRMRDAALTWDDFDRTKKMSRMKLVLKGIVTREDAALALEHGVDGIMVSTHGGHHDAGGRGAIECLPEVVEAVAGRVPVFMDGGVRGGADIFKALAIGATAVGIGRAYVWALASFGQEGVETVVDILKRELMIVMAQTGASSIAGIKRASLTSRA